MTTPPAAKAAKASILRAVAATVLVLAVLGPAHPARAKYLTPWILQEYLDSGDSTKYNRAYGYILGVYDSFEGVIFTHRHDISEAELVEQVGNYIRKHPGEDYYSAQLMVLRAVEEFVRQKDAEQKEKEAPSQP